MAGAMEPEPLWVVAAGAAAAAALAAAAAWARLAVLTAYPGPVGVDGYWYAVQLRSLLEHGRTADATLPASLWFLLPFAAALGPVAGLKLGAAIGVALHALTAFALGRVLARSTAAGLVAAAVVATSPGSIYLTTEFVKQGIALAAVAGFLAALAAARERPGRGRLALAAATGIAAALAHKLAFAVALAALGAVLFDELRRRRGDSRDRRWLVALAVALSAAVLFLAFTRSRWLGLLGATPDFSLPALRFSSGVALRFGHETAAGAAVALALVGLQLAARGRRAGPLDDSPIGWSLVALAVFTAVPWLAIGDPDGIGFRLRISAHLALAPLAGLLLVAAITERRRATAAAVAIAVALLVVRPLAREEGVVRPNPALVEAARRVAAALPAGAEIVTPDRQVAFLMSWESRRPARTRPKDGALDGATWRVLPRAWVDREAAAALDELATGPATPPIEAGVLTLVPETTYRAMLARLSPAARARWDEWDRAGALPPPRPARYHGRPGDEP